LKQERPQLKQERPRRMRRMQKMMQWMQERMQELMQERRLMATQSNQPIVLSMMDRGHRST